MTQAMARPPATPRTIGANTLTFAPGQGLPVLTAEGPEEVLAALSLFLAGWTSTQARHAAPEVICRREGDGYRVQAPVLPGGSHRAAGPEQAADMAASAIAALAVRAPGIILPHAGAVESPRGLVLLIADTTGGKSTLALTLAAQGWRLFGDDRLGLLREGERSTGVALGLAPKLRLPLPPGAAVLAAFAEARMARRWPSLAYLELRGGEQAPPGRRCPVAEALLLERSGGPARLEPAAAPQLVRSLAESAAAPWLGTAEVLAATMAHAALPVRRLVYGEAAEAAPLLLREFGG